LNPPDAENAVWFYARAFTFAPTNYKPLIEQKLDYWYKRSHGAMDGLDEVKIQSATTLFPPGTVVNEPAAPLPEIAPPPPPTDVPPPTISLGQTMNQVTVGFGQPLRVAKLGAKTIFYYKDTKVTFTDGKVSDVE
jgi:hypothetical protein